MQLIIQEGEIFLEAVKNIDIVDKGDINCIGHSFGGLKCLWLSALNEDIKTTVISGSIIQDVHTHFLKEGWITIMPYILNIINERELLTLISPRELIIINGKEDPVRPSNLAKPVVESIKDVYLLQEKPENFIFVIHDSGHIVPKNTLDIIKDVKE